MFLFYFSMPLPPDSQLGDSRACMQDRVLSWPCQAGRELETGLGHIEHEQRVSLLHLLLGRKAGQEES